MVGLLEMDGCIEGNVDVDGGCEGLFVGEFDGSEVGWLEG